MASPTCSLCSLCSFVCDGSSSFLISCFPSPCHRFYFLDGFFSSMLQFFVEHFIPAFRCAVSKNSLYSLKVQSPFAFLSQLHERKGHAVFLQNPRATSTASSLLLFPSAISGSLLVSACHLQCLETNGYLPTLLNSSKTLMSLHFVGTPDCAASRGISQWS